MTQVESPSTTNSSRRTAAVNRRHFIGGSDAPIIMRQDEKALIRLWQEKRG
jgi:predicted phage-related endonuclease